MDSLVLIILLPLYLLVSLAFHFMMSRPDRRLPIPQHRVVTPEPRRKGKEVAESQTGEARRKEGENGEEDGSEDLDDEETPRGDYGEVVEDKGSSDDGMLREGLRRRKKSEALEDVDVDDKTIAEANEEVEKPPIEEIPFTPLASRRCLLITAHPDDECMFFAPSILGLLEQRCDVHLLCLSSGNYERKGMQRKIELRRSCQVLGIPLSNITVVEHTKLPDDPDAAWSKVLIKNIVLRHIETLAIDTVLTFDEHGVSSHSNHIAVHRALRHMYSKGLLPVATQVFVLESVSLWRKYIALLDVLLSAIAGSAHSFISGYGDILRAAAAMLQHRTQLTWYRLLYIGFSRYMTINTLRRMSAEPLRASIRRKETKTELSNEC